jgi:hypothetical protein
VEAKLEQAVRNLEIAIAARAYDAAAVQVCGAFALLNFPDQPAAKIIRRA